MSLRLAAAKVISAISTWGLKNIFKRPAANFPGKIALYFDSQLIADLAPKLQRGSVVICGTNGKTTVNNIFADVIEASGMKVVCNRTGANLDSGVATALLHGADADWGSFECDEMWLSKVLPQLEANYLLMLNLFRDQLDRVGDIKLVQESIVAALKSSPKTVLVYNADDPFCEAIAQTIPNTCIAFGIGEALSSTQKENLDEQMCQKCSSMLDYRYRQYGQLGSYQCPQCGFRRAKLDYFAQNLKIDNKGFSFDLMHQNKIYQNIEANYRGFYMVYNLLAVASLAETIGCKAGVLTKALAAFNPQNGRLESFEVCGRQVLLNLAKNPTGFNQNLDVILSDEKPKTLVFYVNDKEGDGRDVSWLWDVDFEEIHTGKITKVYVGGTRKNDVQLRLKYAGIPASIIVNPEEIFADSKCNNDGYNCYVIANYTALPPVRDVLVRLEQETKTMREQKMECAEKSGV